MSLCPFLRNVIQWKGKVKKGLKYLKFAIVEINKNSKNKETMFFKMKNEVWHAK